MDDSTTVTIGVIEDDYFSLCGLKIFLKKNLPFCSLSWQTSSQTDAINKCACTCPDVILIEMYMHKTSGFHLIYDLRRQYKSPIIFAITSLPVKDYAPQAALAGAQAIVSKNNPQQLCKILTDIKNEVFTPKDINNIHFEDNKTAFYRLQQKLKTSSLSLTVHERKIAQLCAQGLSSTEIAKHLYISTGTVDTIIHRVCKKLQVENRSQLIVTLWRERYWHMP